MPAGCGSEKPTAGTSCGCGKGLDRMNARSDSARGVEAVYASTIMSSRVPAKNWRICADFPTRFRRSASSLILFPLSTVLNRPEGLNSAICFAAGLVSRSGRTPSLFHRSLLRGDHPRRRTPPSFPRSNRHSLKTENRLLHLYKLLTKLGKYLPDIHNSILSSLQGFRNYETSCTSAIRETPGTVFHLLRSKVSDRDSPFRLRTRLS